MSGLSERPVCYKVAVFMLLKSIALFITGFAVPWWAQNYSHDYGIINSHSGLWLGCTQDGCSAISGQPDWFKAVQGLQSLGLAGMLVSCIYTAYIALCRTKYTHTRVIEGTSGVGGFLGLIGCLVYIVNTSPILKHTSEVGYSWGFGLDLAGSILVVLVALIIAVSNSRKTTKDSDRRFYYYYDHHLSRGRLTDLDANGYGNDGVEDASHEHNGLSSRNRRGAEPPESTTEVYVVQTNCPSHIVSALSPTSGRTRRNACSSPTQRASFDPCHEEAQDASGIALPSYAHALQEVSCPSVAPPPPYTPPLESSPRSAHPCRCHGRTWGGEAPNVDTLRQRGAGNHNQNHVTSQDVNRLEDQLHHQTGEGLQDTGSSIDVNHMNRQPCAHLHLEQHFQDLGRGQPLHDVQASAPPSEECCARVPDSMAIAQ